MCLRNDLQVVEWIYRFPFVDAERLRIDRMYLEIDLGPRRILREVELEPCFLFAGDSVHIDWTLENTHEPIGGHIHHRDGSHTRVQRKVDFPE